MLTVTHNYHNKTSFKLCSVLASKYCPIALKSILKRRREPNTGRFRLFFFWSKIAKTGVKLSKNTSCELSRSEVVKNIENSFFNCEMSAYLKLLELFWPIHHCPENPLQKIILSFFWAFKIGVSIYTKYDARKRIKRVRYLNGNNINQSSTFNTRENLLSWIGLYSEEIRDAYSTSSKITQSVTSLRYLWALISDIMHIVFIIMTLGEQKTMPSLSLLLYCSLICSDTIFSISITKRFVKIFNTKTGVILANILLRFFFGPFESYLEFQYFGRTVEGFDKRYVVVFGAFISVFDLAREILEIKIDFRLMETDLISSNYNSDQSGSEPLHRIRINFFEGLKPEKLIEVITFVNFTTFYLEILKVFFYVFSIYAMRDTTVGHACSIWARPSPLHKAPSQIYPKKIRPAQHNVMKSFQTNHK